MSRIQVISDPLVESKFAEYPVHVLPKMTYLRELILETAEETESVNKLEETLKWGEPSYLTKKGSTIRMDWKARSPEQYAMYFQCTTSLVETFKMVYGDQFKYEKNRAIILDLDEEVPVAELKDCIAMALQYHLLKHRPFLGR